jgi:ABC-2 type transport system permease protein
LKEIVVGAYFCGMASYSNFKASLSLIKASLQSIIKSPSAVVFSIAFPLVFILVFGFIGTGRGYSVPVALATGADTNNRVMRVLLHMPVLKWKTPKEGKTVEDLLSEGDVVATIAVREQPDSIPPKYTVMLNSTSSQMEQMKQLRSMINEVIDGQDPVMSKRAGELAKYEVRLAKVREYKMIDFILPGQLGFSLLASGVFGTAFVFFSMRQTLVLKRFFATPVKKEVIVISEGIARLVFQLMGGVLIITIGHFLFGFTLIHGWVTYVNMLLMCAIGMMVFMGFGFIVSSVAKSESTIPPFANIITMPQFLLAGTFFPIDNFPTWLQPFCKALPLTYLNDALRKIAFDGVGLIEVKWDILILLAWGVVVYFIASRIFKWE